MYPSVTLRDFLTSFFLTSQSNTDITHKKCTYNNKLVLFFFFLWSMCLFPLIRWVRWPISSSTAFFRLCSAWAGKRCASCWGGLVPPCGLVVQWTTPTTDSQRPFPTLCPSCVRYLTSTPTPSTSRSSCPTCPSPTAAPPSPRTWRPIVKHWSGKAFTSSRSVSAEMGHLKIDAIYLLFRESRELVLLTKHV